VSVIVFSTKRSASRATVDATPSTRTFFAPDLSVDGASLSDLAAAGLIERGESLDDAWTLLDKGRALARKTIRSKESTR
jgi:hypothetical protein